MFVALERIFLDQYDSSRRNQRPRNICTKLYKKKNYFSILPFPFHILFREQERSFAKRVVAQSLIKLIELNKNPIYIYIGIIKETKKRIHKISKAWWYRTVTKAKREKLRKPLELSSNGDSLRSFLQALLYFSFNENSINERSRLYFVGVDREEDGRWGGGGENEREREIDRSENEAKFKSARERREASGHHSHVSPFWKLRLHAGEPRKIVRGDAVCGWITATQAEAGLANFSSPCGSRLAAAGCAFNIGRIWAGWVDEI